MSSKPANVLSSITARPVRPRVIPVLLIRDGQLYKSLRFKAPKYVGDPRVAVKIFNDKGCDELILLDITAGIAGRPPDFDLIEEIASESFMPVAYGGGVTSVEHARRVFAAGVEKVVLNARAISEPGLVTAVANLAGSSSTVVCIDVRRDWLGRQKVATDAGRNGTRLDPVEWARHVAWLGAGEIVLQSVDRDGTLEGYDLKLVAAVSGAVDVPVVALGGAGGVGHMRAAIDAGAAAAAAGSMFVFQGPHKAVLITYPDEQELDQALLRT